MVKALFPFAALLLAAPALAQPADYVCTAERPVSDGRIRMVVPIHAEGRIGSGSMDWASATGAGGLRISLWTARDGPFDDNVSFRLAFPQSWRGGQDVRLELRRPGAQAPDGYHFAFTTEYRRSTVGIGFYARLGDLRAFAGGGPLIVLVLGRDGKILAQDRFDPATLEPVIAAAAGLRPEFEAMVADYRTRCAEVVEEDESGVI